MLGILYESFIHPITIISGLPSAGIGAILTLMLFRMAVYLASDESAITTGQVISVDSGATIR